MTVSPTKVSAAPGSGAPVPRGEAAPDADRAPAPGLFDALLLAGWAGYWVLVEFHEVPWALALQALLCFGCSVVYLYTSMARFAIGAVVSLLPLLSGIAPYGHATARARIVEVAALQAVSLILLFRDRNVRALVRASLRRPGTRPPLVLWVERTVLWGAAICTGGLIARMNPPLVVGIHRADTLRNAAVVAVAFLIEELTFNVAQFAATRPLRWYWTVLAQFVTVGACFASSRSVVTGFAAGAIAAALTAYRIRDNALWPIALAHALVLGLVCMS